MRLSTCGVRKLTFGKGSDRSFVLRESLRDLKVGRKANDFESGVFRACEDDVALRETDRSHDFSTVETRDKIDLGSF